MGLRKPPLRTQTSTHHLRVQGNSWKTAFGTPERPHQPRKTPALACKGSGCHNRLVHVSVSLLREEHHMATTYVLAHGAQKTCESSAQYPGTRDKVKAGDTRAV